MKFPVLIFMGMLMFGQNTSAQEAKEIQYVKAFFKVLQPISIAANREYCGYFGLDENDNFIATKPTRGQVNGCAADDPPEDMNIFASYHTHGAYDPEADSEVPSAVDMLADADEDVDGYVATPGGRIWFIDTIADPVVARLLCGERCTVFDKNFDTTEFPDIRNSYTVPQVRQRD